MILCQHTNKEEEEDIFVVFVCCDQKAGLRFSLQRANSSVFVVFFSSFCVFIAIFSLSFFVLVRDILDSLS